MAKNILKKSTNVKLIDQLIDLFPDTYYSLVYMSLIFSICFNNSGIFNDLLF